MAIDGDLAFEGPAKGRWTADLRTVSKERIQRQPLTSNALEITGDIAAQAERLPFGKPAPAILGPSDYAATGASRVVPRAHPLRAIGSTVSPAFARAGELLAEYVSPFRLASHLSVLAISGIVLLISQIGLPQWEVTLKLLPAGASVDAADGRSAISRVSAFSSATSIAPVTGQSSLQRSAIPFTIVEEESSKDIQYYTVQQGDTVLGIAERFGIQPETIVWSNAGLDKHVELIRPGDQLAILPVNGAYHTVTAGDTLSGLADKYGVTVEEIVEYTANGLTDASAPLVAGQKIVIPGGSRPFVEQYAVAYNGPIPSNAKIGSGAFVWPASGPITQSYWNAHRALDIGGWTGAPVKAADSGYVVAVAAGGWNTGYGSYVIVDHGNGFSTLYAHLNSVYVRPGESVGRGQDLGSLGNTGNSTGPHLHLEIRYQGVPRNPMGYLP